MGTVDLANETKTDFNLDRTDLDALKTAYAAAVTLANELKTDFNALRADVSALKTAHVGTVGLANETKTDFNALRIDLANSANFALIAGAGADTNIPIAGIVMADTLLFVLHVTAGAADADLTSEAAITSDGNIQIDITDTSGDQLIVFWRTAATATAVAAADAADSAALTSTDVTAVDAVDSAAIGSTAVAAADAADSAALTSTDVAAVDAVAADTITLLHEASA